jgi:hypothetical protein
VRVSQSKGATENTFVNLTSLSDAAVALVSSLLGCCGRCDATREASETQPAAHSLAAL